MISNDGKLICDFTDLQQTGKFNLTLFINNEDMKDRVLEEIILYTEREILEDLKLVSPDKLYFNISESLVNKNLSISFNPQGSLIGRLEP